MLLGCLFYGVYDGFLESYEALSDRLYIVRCELSHNIAYHIDLIDSDMYHATQRKSFLREDHIEYFVCLGICEDLWSGKEGFYFPILVYGYILYKNS